MTYTAATLREVTARRRFAETHYPTRTPLDLLTVSNPKVAKGAAQLGYLPAVLHLAPHTLSGANLCPWASRECAAGCLNTSGRGGIALDASGLNAIQAARVRRSAMMIIEPDAFAAQLVAEVQRHARTAARHGLRPCIRLNGTSDVAWHRTFPQVIAATLETGARLYDYTKRPVPDAAAAGIDLTYSYPGGEGKAARRYLESGYRCAVVFDTPRGAPLPDEWHAPWGNAYPVIDGDAHDLRFTDPAGVIVGLRAKGRLRGALASRFGFVQSSLQV